MKTDVLQRQLDLVSSALLGGLGRILRPRLILDGKAHTASTPGHAWVKLPAAFLGETPDTRPEIFVGLLAHEIGHWLQPLKLVKEIEKETGLNHDIVNLLLDIHGEALAASIFPLFQRHLTAVRSLVRDRKREDYLASFKKAKTFLASVGNLLLMGRYGGDPESSFSLAIASQAARRSKSERVRLEALAQDANSIAWVQRAGLPEFLREIARRYPELCDPQPLSVPDPLETSSGGDGMEKLREELDEICNFSTPPGVYKGDVEATPNGKAYPKADVTRLARSLAFRWTRPRASMTIPGPGRLNRLAAVRGEPIPFTLPIPPAGKAADQVRIVLAVDWSGSMRGDPWRVALGAAQAICLGVRANQGDVRALIFAESSWHAPDYSAEALFAQHLDSAWLSEADGEDTTFAWLPVVWQAFPNHQVVLLTDGVGHLPSVLLPSGRKRTAALLLDGHLPPDAATNAALTLDRIAALSVRVGKLEDLPALWASLIPRRWNA
jgi:hypothetical protein